jgi:methylenetetrahydrofolate dehydrogenase (NADP+) / methenyltetrahydrofolate cyclohydrolase
LLTAKDGFVSETFVQMKILDGKELSAEMLSALPARCAAVNRALGRPPSLAVINCFSDSPSDVYVKRKLAACEKAGIAARLYSPDAGKGYAGFRELLSELEADKGTDAIMVERPLPEGFDIPGTWDALPAGKDVDGLSTHNTGRLYLVKKFSEIENASFFVPCTALAVILLLRRHGFDPAGKNIAVAGRSAVVGRPLAQMLTSLDATVTLCHTRTRDIAEVFKRADIVVAAAGKARWLKGDMLAPGAVVVDVGTNFDESGKMCGDADYESVTASAAAVSPVPGGVGPVTLACLLDASVRAAERRLPEKGGIILT